MLIARCAWHRQYHGYPSLSGVASWRGFGLRFTDGICPRCVALFRTEHQRRLEHRLPLTVARVQESSSGTAA